MISALPSNTFLLRLPAILLGVCLGFLALSLGFEYCSLCIDFTDLLSCPTTLLCLTNFSDHTSIGDINLGLIRRTLVSLPTKKLEILAALGILELFYIGIIATLPSAGTLTNKTHPIVVTFEDRIGSVHSEHSQ